MTAPWGKEFGQAVAEAVKGYVAKEMASRDERISELEKRVLALVEKGRRSKP